MFFYSSITLKTIILLGKILMCICSPELKDTGSQECAGTEAKASEGCRGKDGVQWAIAG